ncbi:ABC transporter substrate-binding protein [Acetobacter lambici]|uniref:ABC transporter substrate-binding protein n=1 Tax=Acetobacter lambici TaxID=1332824 RepID=A0ABT1EWG0_9PROT|nr:ABC transporter substrate-binding protein [Acetobacter lambici]MCP1241055.1 ABC transporter substrate-binding protein [Acetobacter lambici]MCP1257273.1 ABC transporter substrate-binding protein [Acetobacter lambici]NHO55763.1 ABC transporter substrate-binding protein [Acetobacter lambici]
MKRALLKMLTLATVAFGWAVSPVQAAESIRIGYIPVLGSSALFVIDGEGWAKQAGLDVQLVRFTSGPQAIQALVAGRIDGYVAGVLPLLQARAHGVDVKVVATASIEELSVIARGALAQGIKPDVDGGLAPDDVKAIFARFKQDQTRLPRLAAQPAGSVPDTLLRYWLQKQLDFAQVNTVASIVGVDIDAAQQAFLAGAVDGAVLREPALTVVKTRLPDARILASGHSMMPDQPGSVLAIVKPDAPEHKVWAGTLTNLFVRATRLLAQHPDDAVPFVQKALGGGMLNDDVMKTALEHSASRFVSDPARIVESVKQLQEFEVSEGLLRKAEPVEDLFDTGLWQQAKP